MSTKEQLKKLVKYKSDLESRLSSDIPPKHTHRPKEYQQYLKNEILTVSSKIAKIKEGA